MLEAGGRVQSIEKAVRILEILAEAGTPMPLREIARRTELPKSTLHGHYLHPAGNRVGRTIR